MKFLKYLWKAVTYFCFIMLAVCFPHGWIVLFIVLVAEVVSRVKSSSYREDHTELTFKPLPSTRPNLYVVSNPPPDIRGVSIE